MKVRNMKSPRGNYVCNQFIIMNHKGDEIFQSYDSIIAIAKKDGTVKLDENYWNYSRTTAKYRRIFLGENKKETLRKINDGKYILTDLNRGM